MSAQEANINTERGFDALSEIERVVKPLAAPTPLAGRVVDAPFVSAALP
ncbi:MAG TPA: hypothetical protein VNH83_19955 [Bryobacteraceae bacterium]|nr:hypothetical protein [Bryobacteraceae bacterium]